jgi:hypothetical protein
MSHPKGTILGCRKSQRNIDMPFSLTPRVPRPKLLQFTGARQKHVRAQESKL